MCEPKVFNKCGKKFLLFRKEAHRAKFDSADFFKDYEEYDSNK